MVRNQHQRLAGVTRKLAITPAVAVEVTDVGNAVAAALGRRYS